MASPDAIDHDATMSQIVVVVGDLGQSAPSGASANWAQLIPDEPTNAWSWTTTKVWYSVGTPVKAAQGPHFTQGWDLLPKMVNAALVHVCRPYTRAGEVALLAAKALRKRTVLSDLRERTSAIGASFEMAKLADCLICQTEDEAESYSGDLRVEILDLGTAESWTALSNIYTDLVGVGERST